MLDLAFDIDLTKGFAFCNFEYIASLSGKNVKSVFSFIEKMLTIIIVDELCGIAIRFESELLSNES